MTKKAARVTAQADSGVAVPSDIQTAGLPIPKWIAGVPMSLRAYYNIPDELKPRRANIGRKALILESPRDWLERVAAAGGIPAKPVKEVA